MHGTTRPGRTDSACRCRFASGRNTHHEELLRAPTDVATAVALMELATSWYELDYRGEALIPPADWLAFAAEHVWVNPELAQRVFGVAVDIARGSMSRLGSSEERKITL